MEFTREKAPDGVTPIAEIENPPVMQAVDSEQIQKWQQILMKYKAGKAKTERRIVRAEEWWKIRNDSEEELETMTHWSGFRSKSSWLINVIHNKHADMTDSYPSAIVLGREESDEPQAKILQQIIPCVMDMAKFKKTFEKAAWQKLKFGTAAYKIVWDSTINNGMGGDISIKVASILNLFWEPGIEDIQDSRYLFDTELQDIDLIEEQYPQTKGKIKSNSFMTTRFLYDDSVSTDGKATVVGVYYHKNGKLHYCKYVDDIVLVSTENDPEMAERGLYDHGKYPYVFDVMYPIEGSPCGYGIVEICKNPQTEIDLMRTAIVRNAMTGSTPRAFLRVDGSINEEEYLDLTKSIVHVNGNLGEDSIRMIPHIPLDGSYISILQETINELRQTSGNTEAATGSGASGVTSASGLAALQEASGKTSRDLNRTTFEAYEEIVEIVIELIRQFYTIPRQFRIVGEKGMNEYIQFSNEGIQPQDQGNAFGVDLGMRLPVFDIKVIAEKKNAYTTMSQNELALQFLQLGLFRPDMVDQSLAVLDMMQFENRDNVMQKISENGTMAEKYQLLIQYAAALAAKYRDQNALLQLQQIAGVNTQQSGVRAAQETKLAEMPATAKESKITERARQQTAERTVAR